MQHTIITELIPETSQPHQGTNTRKERFISELIRCTSQPRQQTDLLMHRLARELTAKRKLVNELSRGCTYSSVN
jgi:hypothetical protein